MNRLSTFSSLLPPPEWDRYVLAHRNANVAHLSAAVGIGAEAFGLQSYFLHVRDSVGAIRGVLPVVKQTLVPWVPTLVSVPFFTYGGPLFDDEHGLTALLDQLDRLSESLGARRVVLRHVESMPTIPHPESLDKIAMRLELPGTTAELSEALGSKLRSQIRRADRLKPSVRIGGAELVGDFYAVFCNVMRDLGTPVYPKRFFEVVLKSLGSCATVVVVSVGGRPVSGAIAMRWRDELEIPWAATLGSMRPDAINMRLYWELMRFAVESGCRVFDFGRSSRDGGTHRFKAQWGASPLQLHWHLWHTTGSQAQSSAPTGGESAALLSRVWQRLPLAIANAIGPRISHRLPW